MDCVMLQNENNELRGQKRKLEDYREKVQEGQN